MIFLVVLGLTAVLGVKSEYNCSAGPPSCLEEYARSADEPFREYLESGKPLPSNKIITSACPPVLGIMECIREQDALHCIIEEGPEINYAALYNSATEFCNEESDVRKGYVANVDCVNNITADAEACETMFGEGIKNRVEEEKEALEKMGVTETCLFLGMMKACATVVIEDQCGKEAGQTAHDIMSGIENIVYCGGSVVEEAINFLTSKIENLI